MDHPALALPDAHHGANAAAHRRAQAVRALRRLALAALFVCAWPAAATPWYLPPELSQRTFVESDGKELRLSEVGSPLVVMTMAYAACQKVCSNTTLVLADIQRRLDAMGQRAEFIVVSYDPHNDTPADWQDYRRRRGLGRANWHFLTGDPESTRSLARHLDLDFWTYHEHIVHDFRIVLFDSRWKVIDEVDWSRIDRLPEILRRSVELALAAR
jgi:cytochrome oxidase Cu insertion factor (SCO1/SenC/PrrC family)